MNFKVILFLLAVVVLFLCVTGVKVKNKNMQKLVKCSVPLVLFVALMLCMSKTVEPYCGSPSKLDEFTNLTPASQAIVNSASPLIGDRRMGFMPGLSPLNSGLTLYGSEWIGSDCNNDSEHWVGSAASPADGTPGFKTGINVVDPSTESICSQACTQVTERDLDGDSRDYYELGAMFGTEPTNAAECILSLGNDSTAFTNENFGSSALSTYDRFTTDGVTVDSTRSGKRVLTAICDKMDGAPTQEARTCLGLDLPTQVGVSGYEQSCPGLHAAFDAAVAGENNCDNAYQCNNQCQYEAVSGYRGNTTCPASNTLPECTTLSGNNRGACPAPTDCVGAWGACDASCQSTYTVTTRAARGGQPCDTGDGTIQDCSNGEGNCIDVDCVMGSHPGASDCTIDCGTLYTPTITPQQGIGTSCSASMQWACSPGDGACPSDTTGGTGGGTGGTGGGTGGTGGVTYEIVSARPSSDSTVYRVYVTLDASTQSNIYTIAGTSQTPLNFPPCIQDPSSVSVNIGGISSAITTRSAFQNAAYDSWLTVGPTEGSSGEISSVGVDFGTWDHMGGLSVDNGAVFWMSPSGGPSAAGGGICVAQLNIPNCVGNDRRTITFLGQGRSMSGGADWQQAYSILIPAPAGEGQGCVGISGSTTVGIDLQYSEYFRILQCLQDGVAGGEVCAAGIGCDEITLDFANSVSTASAQSVEINAAGTAVAMNITAMQQQMARETNRPVDQISISPSVLCDSPITLPP